MTPYYVGIPDELDWADLMIRIVDEGSFVLTLGVSYENKEVYLLNATYKN